MASYIRYISKTHRILKLIADYEKVSLLYLYLDYAWCFIRHGCLINQYYNGNFYKTPCIIRKKSFTQRRLERIIRLCNDERYIKYLEDKTLFNEYFSEFVHRKWLCSKHMSKQEFICLCDSNSELFIKPIDAMEGEGVRKITINNDNLEYIYEDLIKQDVLIEESIKQHSQLNIGNASVNSSRILTVLDNYGKAHVIRAGLRAGVGGAVVDNFSAGGVLYQIDIKSGRIDHKGIQGTNYDIIYHPNTNLCMLGYQIPNWSAVLETVVKAAEKLPGCRFIGWDVAITNNSVELIEGNHNPGIFTLESLGTPGAYEDVMEILIR